MRVASPSPSTARSFPARSRSPSRCQSTRAWRCSQRCREDDAAMRLPVSTPCGDKALQAGVARWVVAGVIAPEAPDHAGPGASEDTDGVWVAAAALSCADVDIGGPGIVVAAGVSEGIDRVSQAMVAGPAEASPLGLAGLDRDGGLAGVGSQGCLGWVALAAVAHLGEHGGGGDRRLGIAEQRTERLAVEGIGEGGADLAGEFADAGDDRLECGDEGEHDLAAGLGLELVCATRGGATQAGEKLARGLAPGVAVASEESCHALLSEPVRVDWGGVAPQERECDRAVDVSKDLGCAGPEASQLSAQLVSA